MGRRRDFVGGRVEERKLILGPQDRLDKNGYERYSTAQYSMREGQASDPKAFELVCLPRQFRICLGCRGPADPDGRMSSNREMEDYQYARGEPATACLNDFLCRL